MKRASKIITLILVVVLMVSVFAGCAMFGKNIEKYRSTTIMNVGKQTVSIGELLDSFNTQYNNYYYYIQQGYFTAEQVFEIAANSVYEQAMKVDAYTSKPGVAKTDNTTYKNGEYLTAEELSFVVRYVKYLVFTSFDAQVEEFLSSDYEFAAEEEEDTSRDFTKFDDLKGSAYSKYLYEQNFVNEDMEEYLSERYAHLTAESLVANDKIDGYVFTTAEQAAETLKKYNDRLDEDTAEEDKLTFETLKATQEKVVRLYQNNIKASYGYSDLSGFVKNQIEAMIKSIIVAKYNYDLYSTIDTGAENIAKTVEALKVNSEGLAANQKADYFYNDNFDTFITGLADTSYLYAVDADESAKYIFVKNILIPFSAEQTQSLSSLAAILGSEEHPDYLAARLELVKDIEADDFNSDKDADGKYSKVSGLFDVVDGKIVIKSDSALGANLQNGVVTAMEGKTKTETIVELMKRFNTDTAQHTKAYDYVVRIADDDNYTQPWVEEFVVAAKEAKALGKESYSICVSSYGVHIVYYSADVTAMNSDETFQQLFEGVVGKGDADTSSPAYKIFKAYFETQSSTLVSEDLKELRKTYADGKLATATKEYEKFMKDNSLEYAFEDLIATEEEETDDHEGHNH